MSQKFLSIMPEFELIQAPNLQERTFRIWLQEMSKSGWDIEDLKEMHFTLIIENSDQHHRTHQSRGALFPGDSRNLDRGI